MNEHAERLDLTRQQSEVLNLAIQALELIMRAHLLGIVCQNDSAIFLHLRPGDEAPIARRLAEIDWTKLIRFAEEHGG